MCIRSVQFVYVHSYSWDIDTYSTALKTTGNYFPSLRVFSGKAKFWASSCRQNGPSQLAPMDLFNIASSTMEFDSRDGRENVKEVDRGISNTFK